MTIAANALPVSSASPSASPHATFTLWDFLYHLSSEDVPETINLFQSVAGLVMTDSDRRFLTEPLIISHEPSGFLFHFEQHPPVHSPSTTPQFAFRKFGLHESAALHVFGWDASFTPVLFLASDIAAIESDNSAESTPESVRVWLAENYSPDQSNTEIHWMNPSIYESIPPLICPFCLTHQSRLPVACDADPAHFVDARKWIHDLGEPSVRKEYQY